MALRSNCSFKELLNVSTSLFRNGPTTTGGEDRFQPTEKPSIDLHTQDYGAAPDISINLRQPKHGLCADIICGDSGYLRTTFHLQFPTVLHSIRAAETSKPLISIKL